MLYFPIQNDRGERELTSVARRVADGRFCLVGSCTDRSRIVNDVSLVFEKFL